MLTAKGFRTATVGRVLAMALLLGPISTSIGCAARQQPSLDATRVLPVTILICREGFSRTTIDSHGILDYDGPLASDRHAYAKMSNTELAELRTIIESQEYRDTLRARPAPDSLIVCGLDHFVRIKHYGMVGEIDIANEGQTPEPIRALLAFVDRVNQEHLRGAR